MDKEQKMSMLEEMLDIPEGTLTEDMVLKDLTEWDSLAVISLIALIDERFDKTLTGSEIKAFRTIGDILKVME